MVKKKKKNSPVYIILSYSLTHSIKQHITYFNESLLLIPITMLENPKFNSTQLKVEKKQHNYIDTFMFIFLLYFLVK